jgi:hypothetical protein
MKEEVKREGAQKKEEVSKDVAEKKQENKTQYAQHLDEMNRKVVHQSIIPWKSAEKTADINIRPRKDDALEYKENENKLIFLFLQKESNWTETRTHRRIYETEFRIFNRSWQLSVCPTEEPANLLREIKNGIICAANKSAEYLKEAFVKLRSLFLIGGFKENRTQGLIRPKSWGTKPKML